MYSSQAVGPKVPGVTRAAPPERVWEAAQVADMAALAQAWLHRPEHAAARAPRMRL